MLRIASTRGSSIASRSRSDLSTRWTKGFNQGRPFHPRHFASSAQDDPQGSFSIWYPIVGGFLITIGGGIKWWHDHVGGTEGLKRSADFYSYAIPRYGLYRYHVWRKSPDEVWDALDKETSQEALRRIRYLRGFYIKAGQLAAANVGDGLYVSRAFVLYIAA